MKKVWIVQFQDRGRRPLVRHVPASRLEDGPYAPNAHTKVYRERANSKKWEYVTVGETAQQAVDLYNASPKAQIAMLYEQFCSKVDEIKSRMAVYPEGSVPANFPVYETVPEELRRLRQQRNPLYEYVEAIERGEA